MLQPAHTEFARQRLTHANFAISAFLPATASVSSFVAVSLLPAFAPQLGEFSSAALLYLLLGTGLALEIRLAGVPDFAFTAWFAIAAGCEALMMRTFALPFWVCLPAGMILAATTAVFLISPLLRMRREAVALITLGFGGALQILCSHLAWPVMILPGNTGLQHQILIAVTAFACLACWRIRRSSLALILRAANEDETACHAVGVNVHRCRIIIVAIGAMAAGAAGCLFAAGQGGFRPADFDVSTLAVVLVIAVYGGRRSQSGTILAAALAAVVSQFFPAASDLRLLIAGGALLCWPLLRSIAIAARRGAMAGDLPRTEAAVQAAAE